MQQMSRSSSEAGSVLGDQRLLTRLPRLTSTDIYRVAEKRGLVLFLLATQGVDACLLCRRYDRPEACDVIVSWYLMRRECAGEEPRLTPACSDCLVSSGA